MRPHENKAATAKEIAEKNGIFSSANPKHGKKLNEETTNAVKLFYDSDENSKLLPRMKDYVSGKQVNGS